MIRRLSCCLLCAVSFSIGCGRVEKPEIKQGPVTGEHAPEALAQDATRPASVPGALPDNPADRVPPPRLPGAIPETRPEIQAQIRPDRRGVDENSKYNDIKTPFVRVLMESLDQAEGGTSSEIDLTRKTLRENDAILDKAFRDVGPLMKRANTRKAAIRVTHQQPTKPAVRETPPVDATHPQDGATPNTVPGATGAATPAGTE